MKANHSAIVAELAEVKATLNKTEEELRRVSDTAEMNITSSSNALSNVLAELTTTSYGVASLKTDSNATRVELATVKADLKSAQDELKRLTDGGNHTSYLEALAIGRHELDICRTNVLSLRPCVWEHQFVTANNQCPCQLRGKEVAFQVSLSGGSRGYSTLKFDNVNYNTANDYNKTTGMLTAPISGTYLFWANVMFYKSIGGHFIYLLKGQEKVATGYANMQHEEEIPDLGVASIMTVLQLDKTDAVHFATTSTHSLIAGYDRSSYGGALLYTV